MNHEYSTEARQSYIEALKGKIEDDIAKGLYYGAVIRVARGGETLFESAIGSADAEGTRPLKQDSVFSIFSLKSEAKRS